MLVPSVEGDCKQRTRLPFESDALAGVVPNRRGAEAGQYVDHFLDQLSLRREFCPSRDFAHVAVVRGPRGGVIEVDAGSSAPYPRLQRNGAQVRDVVRADDVQTFASHPARVRRVFFGRKLLCEFFRDDSVSSHGMLLHLYEWDLIRLDGLERPPEVRRRAGVKRAPWPSPRDIA